MLRRGNHRSPQKVLESKEKVEAVASPASVVSQEQMEKELNAVWEYFIYTPGQYESLTPDKKQMGFAILQKIASKGCDAYNRVLAMTRVIDMTQVIVKKNPKKEYLRTWVGMFSKWKTFASIHGECVDNWDNIPHAARFLEEFEPTNVAETADACS